MSHFNSFLPTDLETAAKDSSQHYIDNFYQHNTLDNPMVDFEVGFITGFMFAKEIIIAHVLDYEKNRVLTQELIEIVRTIGEQKA